MALQRQLKLMKVDALEKPVEPASRVRVAFASSDLKKIDQHFGSAERFVLYDVIPEEHTLHQVFEFGTLDQDGNERKLLEKFVALEGCVAVYCLAVGPSAVRQLMSLNIQPLKVPFGTSIGNLLGDLHKELQEGPEGWLARALSARDGKSAGRFDEMEDEGWQE
jgi:nitrogen fixation protein NifX